MPKEIKFKEDWYWFAQAWKQEEQFSFYMCIFRYAFQGIDTHRESLPQKMWPLFELVKNAIDRSDKWKKAQLERTPTNARPMPDQCQTNAEPMPNQCSTNAEPSEKEKSLPLKEKENTLIPQENKFSLPPKKKIFRKPTLEEVAAYCEERQNGMDPAQFIDFYESKGWMIGKNPMKDWHAAVRTWEKHNTKPRRDYTGL